MTTSRYHWPSGVLFDPNNPYHQGWAIVSYLGGVFVTPNPQFNPQDEIHRLVIFTEIAIALHSPLRYTPRVGGNLNIANPPANNVTQMGSNGVPQLHLQVHSFTPQPTIGAQPVVSQVPRTIVFNTGAPSIIANPPLPPDPAFAARLIASRGVEGGADRALGRFALRKANQLLQTDIAALRDIIDEAIGYARMTERRFLNDVFFGPPYWNSSIPSTGEPSPIKKTKETAASWAGWCRIYNLELCLIRARHRLHIWYWCGPAIPVGGQGVPIYGAIPNEREFAPKMA